MNSCKEHHTLTHGGLIANGCVCQERRWQESHAMHLSKSPETAEGTKSNGCHLSSLLHPTELAVRGTDPGSCPGDRQREQCHRHALYREGTSVVCGGYPPSPGCQREDE